MPKKLRFIWEEHGMDEELEIFSFSGHFKDLEMSIFCGKFSQSVSVNGADAVIIHFTNFRFFDGKVFFELDSTPGNVDIVNYENLTFTIITPGIIFIGFKSKKSNIFIFSFRTYSVINDQQINII